MDFKILDYYFFAGFISVWVSFKTPESVFSFCQFPFYQCPIFAETFSKSFSYRGTFWKASPFSDMIFLRNIFFGKCPYFWTFYFAKRALLGTVFYGTNFFLGPFHYFSFYGKFLVRLILQDSIFNLLFPNLI